MKIASTLPMLALVTTAGVLATGAAAAGGGQTLVIRHQLKGCHSWSANGDAFKASQAIKLHRGASLMVTNNDVMPHKLIETSGPAVRFTRAAPGMGMGMRGTFPPSMMARMGAGTKVTFTKAGTYTFTTKVGEDYMKGVKTVGEDNVLKLKVVVS